MMGRYHGGVGHGYDSYHRVAASTSDGKGVIMGKRATEALEVDYNGLVEYLHYNHSVYMRIDDKLYYLTDANFEAWRAQDTSHRNHKNHYIDCSPLVSTLDEFMAVPFIHGKTIKEEFDHATFYASEKGEKE